MRSIVLFLAAVATACAGARPTNTTNESFSAIERAETIGRAIYSNDDASARATDAVLAAHVPRDSVIGWVTQPRGGDRYDVTFVGGTAQLPDARYIVHVTASATQVETIDPPRALDDQATAMFRARDLVGHSAKQLAQQAGTELCASSYNAVVLPASLRGETGWLVYLLAATTDPNRKILTGHLRVRVSPDGGTVLETTALSKKCVVVDAQPAPGAQAVGLFITHVLDPTPIETDVFASLLYKVPLWVIAGGKTWVVDGDKITTAELPTK